MFEVGVGLSPWGFRLKMLELWGSGLGVESAKLEVGRVGLRECVVI